ncbi:MAG: guanylate kinase, partial [Muribaculaceae bacterium]|nr:guanylate kinase [Muribaculaceae bacterium]
MAGKVIIISAPSGSGKSTIINALMKEGKLNMQFSVSATNRAPRGAEQNGVDYHFLSTEEFQQAIADDAFLEYEEVYPGRYYGTLKSEITRI